MDPDKIRIEKKGLVGKILYGSNTCKISRFLQRFTDLQHQVMYLLKSFRGRVNNIDLLVVFREKCVTQLLIIIFAAGESVVLPDVQYVPDIGRVIVLVTAVKDVGRDQDDITRVHQNRIAFIEQTDISIYEWQDFISVVGVKGEIMRKKLCLT